MGRYYGIRPAPTRPPPKRPSVVDEVLELPVGLDELAQRMRMKDSAGNYLLLPDRLTYAGSRIALAYRCRYCRAQLSTDDAGCPTCGAPAERQRAPRGT
jgi:hypothetical protein